MIQNKLALTAIATALLVASPAHALDVKISGQVNQAVILGGDAKGDDISVVDNNMSGSRFRFTGTQEAGSLKFGIRYELQFQDNKSSDAGASGSVAGAQSEVRWAQAFVQGAFGKLAIGKSEGAASDITDANFGNGNFYSTPQLTWLAYRGTYRDAIGDETAGLFIPFDVAGRSNNIQYHSPNFSGFKLALGIDNGDQTEAALRYNGKIGGHTLRARVGVRDTDTAKFTGGSIMLKTSFGLAVGLSKGNRDDSDTADYTGYHLAYNIGKLSFGIEGAEEDDGPQSVTSVGATYRPAKGVAVYVNRSDFDLPSGESVDGVMAGLHIKF